MSNNASCHQIICMFNLSLYYGLLRVFDQMLTLSLTRKTFFRGKDLSRVATSMDWILNYVICVCMGWRDEDQVGDN